MDKLEVWIGCLACYNEGRLVGRWFDADEAATVTVEAVHEGSRLTGINSPDAARWSPDEAVVLVPEHHEEVWVFDHQGFGRLLTGECSPERGAAYR